MQYDVIIIGGSYAGLAAAMVLGRALRKVLIIDSGRPCNRQTPYAHNFLTRDGTTPGEIAGIARQQVAEYTTVTFFHGLATHAHKVDRGFEVGTGSGEIITAAKLVFATGIRDRIPAISGISECWGISVLHCPYCHGYEVRGEATGILGNGEYGFEFSRMISNWTNKLTLFTNGRAVLSTEQLAKLAEHRIRVIEKEVAELEHVAGQLQQIVFTDGSKEVVKAMYTRVPFEQHCRIPEQSGCLLTDEGYLLIDPFHETTVKGIFACGDNVTRLRTLANAVSMGTTTGMMVNRALIEEMF